MRSRQKAPKLGISNKPALSLHCVLNFNISAYYLHETVSVVAILKSLVAETTCPNSKNTNVHPLKC